MKLALDTIKAAGPTGTTKDGFLKQLFKTKDRKSVLGTYSIDKNGDTTPDRLRPLHGRHGRQPDVRLDDQGFGRSLETTRSLPGRRLPPRQVATRSHGGHITPHDDTDTRGRARDPEGAPGREGVGEQVRA